MQERESEVGVCGRQGGALAVSRLFSAKAAGIGLAGRSVQVAELRSLGLTSELRRACITAQQLMAR